MPKTWQDELDEAWNLILVTRDLAFAFESPCNCWRAVALRVAAALTWICLCQRNEYPHRRNGM